MERWQAVWQKRKLDANIGSTLAQLMALDGFDRLGKVDEQAWYEYTHRIAAEIKLALTDSLFEVGCGAGAFLYPFYQAGHVVGGVDYAANLVRLAAQAMPEAAVQTAEAAAFSVAPQYDIVVSSGVFLYFPSHDYALRTLIRMIDKARKMVAVLDVPDMAQRDQAQALREQALGRMEYQRLYAGLDHLYFTRDWFAAALESVPCKIRIVDQNIKGYLHNSYRFNVFIELENSQR